MLIDSCVVFVRLHGPFEASIMPIGWCVPVISQTQKCFGGMQVLEV